HGHAKAFHPVVPALVVVVVAGGELRRVGARRQGSRVILAGRGTGQTVFQRKGGRRLASSLLRERPGRSVVAVALGIDRQDQAKGGALAELGIDLDAPLVLFDGGVDDAQAQARAASRLLGRVERV